MQTSDPKNDVHEDTTDPSKQSKSSQQKSDPQITELKGFIDSKEDLEPTLEDGTKAPEKANEEHEKNLNKS